MMTQHDILAALVAQALQIGTLNSQLGEAERLLVAREERVTELEAAVRALRRDQVEGHAG